jgi:enoyl-CoA hydratase/carnithine racemase
MAYETLLVESDGSIARVWLDRPRQHNPLNAVVLEELITVFAELQRHTETTVVILGGRGPSFSAGADRKDPPGRPPRRTAASARARRYTAQLGLRAVQAIERADATTIARLHGHVIGGAVLLALACDLRVAAQGTSFWIPEVDLGVPLTWGGAPRLAREVGVARAKELILLCDRFDAQTAERYGLINRVVADDALDAAVDEWSHRLADKPPWAVHMTKSQFRAYGRMSVLGDATEFDGDLLSAASAEDPALFPLAGRGKGETK